MITLLPRREAVIDETLVGRIPAGVRVVRTWAPDLPALAARLLGRRQPSSDGTGPAESQRQSPFPSANSGAGGQAAAPAGALKRLVRWLSCWMHVPDSRSAWLPSAVWAGLHGPRPSVIFSSAPMWTSHLAAGVLSRLLRVPWVADFRDPWCGNEWNMMPAGSVQRTNEALERWVVGRATRITCAWDGIRRLLCERYPHRAAKMETVLNGFDEEEVDPVTPERIAPHRCVMLHAGTLYGPRSPVSLFAGLRQLRQEHPAEALRLLVVLVGRPTWNGQPLSDLASREGVSDLVQVVPPTEHRRALAMLKGGEAGILFGQGGEQGRVQPVAAKVYEYVGTGKAVLAVGAGQEAVDILRRGGCRVWTAEDTAASCAAALRMTVAAYHRGELARRSPDERRKLFTRSAMAERLARILEEARGVGCP